LQWLGAAREALRAKGLATDETKRLLHEIASQGVYEHFVREAIELPKKKGAA
jgi:hypothetical protein